MAPLLRRLKFEKTAVDGGHSRLVGSGHRRRAASGWLFGAHFAGDDGRHLGGLHVGWPHCGVGVKRGAILWVLLCLFAVSAQARLALSDAYQAPFWLSESVHVLAVVEEPVLDGRPPAPSAAEARESTMVASRRRYEKGRRMHRMGNIMAGIGSGVAVVSMVALSTGMVNPWSRRRGDGLLFAATVLGTVGGVGLAYAGGALSTIGALRCTLAVNQGLGAGVSFFLSIGSFAALGGAPFVGPLIAVALSSVQMSKIRRGLENAGLSDLQLSPMPHGFALSGRF